MLAQILDFLIEKNWTSDGKALTKVICYNQIIHLQETKYFFGSDWSNTFTAFYVLGIDLDFATETFQIRSI